MMIITIDGPAGSGKSTVARKVAEALNIVYCDTGAMYRAVTLQVIQTKTDLKDPLRLKQLLADFKYEIRLVNSQKRYLVNQKDVTEQLRTQEVTSLVSEVSAVPAIREHLVAIQRQVAQHIDAVFEGRDQGTVVFPHAEVKVFLSAKPEVRAKRRFEEFRLKHPNKDTLRLEEILKDIIRRDDYDSSRDHSPLRPADDAHLIDTSDLSIDDVVTKILGLVKK